MRSDVESEWCFNDRKCARSRERNRKPEPLQDHSLSILLDRGARIKSGHNEGRQTRGVERSGGGLRGEKRRI